MRHPRILIGTGALVVAGLGLVALVAGSLIPVRAHVTVASQKLEVREPLEIRLSFPANRRTLNPQIDPPVDGSWQWRGGIAGRLANRLVFTPTTAWQPEQPYTVTLANVGPVLSSAPTVSLVLQAETLPLPTIASASIAENQTGVLPDQEIHLTLDQPLQEAVDFSFRLDPEAPLEVTPDPANARYRLRPLTPLVAGQTYRLFVERELVHQVQATGEIERREGPERVFERLFTVKTPPKVTEVTPGGDAVLPVEKQLTIRFSAAMDRPSVESRLTLSPQPLGAWRWADDQTLHYDATEALPLDTTYQVILTPGSLDRSAGVLEQEVRHSFKTVGALRALSVSPTRKSGVGLQTAVQISFDQPADQQSVVSRLAVEPAAPVRFEWAGNTLRVIPSNGWSYHTTYRVVVAKGALGIYGRPSQSEILATFTTEEKVVVLNVPWDRQDRALSCEAASLKMALFAKGVRVTEDAIMSHVGYDPTPRTSGGWGDPDVAFVGDINGSQNTTGYGVHWLPIARAANVWRPAKAVTGLTLQEAARELEAGNPIVIWGVQGRAYYDPWLTPSGKKIEAWKGQHARTLIGFRGSVANPTSFIINDPIAGRLTWSAAKLRDDWAKFSNAGVIVY